MRVDKTPGFPDEFQIYGPAGLGFYSFRDYIAMVPAIEHELAAP